MSSPYNGNEGTWVGVGVGAGILGGVVVLGGCLWWMGKKLVRCFRGRREGWERRRLRRLDLRVREQRELEEQERRVWRRELEVDRIIREVERGDRVGAVERWRAAKNRAEQLLEADIQHAGVQQV